MWISELETDLNSRIWERTFKTFKKVSGRKFKGLLGRLLGNTNIRKNQILARFKIFW